MFPITRFTAGDSLNFSVQPFRDEQGASYDSGTYTLTLALRGPQRLDATAIADGTGWKFSIAPSATQPLSAGTYAWSLIASSASVRYTAMSGSVTVDADLSAISADGYDGRTLARRALDDAEAALADLNASGKKTKQYSIGDRSAVYYTAAELATAISYWRIRVANEAHADAKKNGLADPSLTFVRFR